MIGTKIYKNSNEDMEKYSSYAQWCNSNDAYIEDKGEYFEIIQNIHETIEISLDEKIIRDDKKNNNILDRNEYYTIWSGFIFKNEYRFRSIYSFYTRIGQYIK